MPFGTGPARPARVIPAAAIPTPINTSVSAPNVKQSASASRTPAIRAARSERQAPTIATSATAHTDMNTASIEVAENRRTPGTQTNSAAPRRPARSP